MDEQDAAADRRQYLTIYLQDHKAGAEAGLRLAERCRDHAPDGDTKDELSRLVTEIDDDRRTLATIMAGLDVDPSTVKQIAGLAAERLARLKLNGRVVRTSPLSVLVELEGLIGAVSVKRELWTTLRTLAARADGRDAELEALTERADDQRSRLQALHDRATSQLFGDAGNGVAQDRTSSPSDIGVGSD
ncbi:MAG: hypothetical protein ABW328_18705 [Ilumatobacteraceae bacterium]